jgi:hypothetical protein
VRRATIHCCAARLRHGVLISLSATLIFVLFGCYFKIKYELVTELFQLDALDRDLQMRELRKHAASAR